MGRKYKCTGCKKLFYNPPNLKGIGVNYHSYLCFVEHRNKLAMKATKKKEAKDKKVHTAAKKRLNDNDRSFQIDKTQKIFNKYIRLRDDGHPCISCNRMDHEISYSGVGGKWDCGHYKTRGAYPELRFDERNAFRQCKKCNGGSGKYSRKGRSVKEGYDTGLLERVGQEVFDWLNGPHEPKRYTIEDLKEIQVTFKQMTKELKQ